jgi:hypothetical protein
MPHGPVQCSGWARTRIVEIRAVGMGEGLSWTGKRVSADGGRRATMKEPPDG